MEAALGSDHLNVADTLNNMATYTPLLLVALIFCLQGCHSAAPKPFTITKDLPLGEHPCNASDVVSCQLLNVDFELLGRKRLELPGGEIVKRRGAVKREVWQLKGEGGTYQRRV